MWTGESLLALGALCEENNVIDLVTVVKHSEQMQMTSVREQCSSFKPQLQAVRRDTVSYSLQLRRLFSSPEFRSTIPEPAAQHALVQSHSPLLLYYPFGGVDVVSALAFPATVRCTVFAGAETFATGAQALSSDLSKLMFESSTYMQKGAGATMFDSHDDFEQLHEELGLTGVGAMALVRLLGPLAHAAEVIAFFDLGEHGDITFIPPHLVSSTPCKHAVVGVRDGREDPRRYLFFIQHNTRIEDASVDAFCKRLRPDFLLIKAAPDSLWQQHQSLPRCLGRALAPASRANAIVVTDSGQVDPTKPPCIFREGVEVDSMAFKELAVDEGAYEVFGYGERVFWTRGNNLRQ